MRLSELCAGLPDLSIKNAGGDSEIAGLALDSRKSERGFLFAALSGTQTDGLQYIDNAVERGAAAVLLDESAPDISCRVPLLRARNPRQVLGAIAKRFYQPLPEHIVAVTGTNGKTSVATFCRQLWALSGRKAANLGTTGLWLQSPGAQAMQEEEGVLTSPDVISLYQRLHRLHKQGVNHVALEASSHGLDQERMAALDIEAAAFTNLTRDHLDYHQTLEAYLEAKKKLFSELLGHSQRKNRRAVVFADDPQAKEVLRAAAGVKTLTYGAAAEADVRIADIRCGAEGIEARLVHLGKNHALFLPLIGEFQLYNAVCAMLLAARDRMPLAYLMDLARQLQPVPGRMERVGAHPAGALVLVDYAHTPDALRQVLLAARRHVGQGGKLHALFGCGGDRDRGKRPQMGAAARELADNVLVTDDNPRHEDAAIIRQEILAAVPEAKEIGDRKEAIHHALEVIGKGDVLVIAGKGHETYQQIGDIKHPFSDKEVVLKWLGK